MSEYPRPQCVRSKWQSLNGSWNYSFQETSRVKDLKWQGKITVPFVPEAKLSGVHDTGYHSVIWYQHEFEIPKHLGDNRLYLHFGAVDYTAQVWVNEQLVAQHEGGHTPFWADITDVLVEGKQTIFVRAEDDPHDLAKPRGKQEWLEEPHGIWYPRSTGIWQTVWLEVVPVTHITQIRYTPNLSTFSILFEATITGEADTLELEFNLGKERLALDSTQVLHGKVKREIFIPVTDFDNARRFLWSPEHPNLIDVHIKLKKDQTVIDDVGSYTALRSIEAKDGKFFLNHRPYFLRLALDQGYWEDGLMTAPNDEALKKDIELAKAMGFNGVRKHQKIEDPRFLYWADKLGLLVWEEMPSAYHFTRQAVQRLTKEWLEVLNRDYNHPCIVTWVCFNESWGVPDLPHSAEQRNYVAALYHLTKSLDSTRLVVSNDGWEHTEGDLLTIHDYRREAEVLGQRYGTPEASKNSSQNLILEHGKVTLLDDARVIDQPIILSEFGGIRYSSKKSDRGWGYQEANSPKTLLDIYASMIKAISGGLAGFCYTQLTDTFQEQNGLLYMDRRPKVALQALADATQGRE